MTFAPVQTVVAFPVYGHPEPAGSKRAVPTRANWRTMPGVRWKVLDDNPKSQHWKDVVSNTAKGEMLRRRMPLFDGPLYLSLVFIRERPKSHLKTNGELSAEGHRHPYPSTKPDALKLARAVEDALTGAVYTDDALIVSERIRKEWGMAECVLIEVMPL